MPERNTLELPELVGMVVARHHRVVLGRAQVLAERQDRDAHLAQILEHLHDLVLFFAEAHHHAGLGGNVRRVRAGAIEQFEQARVLAARADRAIQARHGFRVVVQHVGPRVEHGLKGCRLALEIRNQHFDAALGQPLLDVANGLRKDRRTAIRQVVAIHRGDDGVLQRHLFDGFADAARLVDVERGRLAVRHRAVGAGARADVAEDHERGRAVMPALADVGAAGVLADRVQLEVAHDAAQAQVILRPRRAHLQPLGLRLTRFHEMQRRLDHLSNSTPQKIRRL